MQNLKKTKNINKKTKVLLNKKQKVTKNKFTMLNKNFLELNKEFKNSEDRRNIIFSMSRVLVKNSKQAIYCIHRNDISEAKKLIKKIEQDFSSLRRKNTSAELEKANMYHAAIQEYVEAKTFLDFMLIGTISTSSKLKVKYHDYLCGLADLTGELGRYAVICATNHNFQKVKEIKEFVDYLFGQFLKFDFNNGELRKKYDAVKWNLNKIEGILYDFSKK
jgi:predicted translin family RNA/ssDNA-binding protein